MFNRINEKQLNSKIVYLLLILFVFALYGNSIKNNYSLDDHLVNKHNSLTQKGIQGIPSIFKQHSFHDKQLPQDYRPILLTSFAVEYALFGTNPHISHFISILLYAVFVVLLYVLLQLLFTNVDGWVKFLTIILFIAFPIHTEVVDNIKSRDELLVAIFGILMIIHFIKLLIRKKIYHLFFILLFFTAGYLTKQSILMYAAIIPFLYLHYFVSIKIKKWKPILLTFTVLMTSLVTIMLYKHQFLQYTAGRNLLFYENPLITTSFFNKIAAGLAISLYNIKLLVYPFNLVYYYGYDKVPIIGWSNFLPYIGIIFFILLVYFIIKNFKHNFFLSFGGIVLFINIIAAANIFKLIPGIVGERFLFLGSIGYIMILVFYGFNFLKKINWIKKTPSEIKFTTKSILLATLIIIAYSTKVYSRNKNWNSEFSLINNDMGNLLNSAKANDMLAYQLFGKIKSSTNETQQNLYINKAIKHYNQALSIYPKYTTCWNNLGTLYFLKKEYTKSELCFKKALSIDENDANPLLNLGNIYQRQLKMEKARLCYEKALINNSSIDDLIPTYKQFIIKTGKINTGIVFIKHLIEKNRSNYQLTLLLIDFYNLNNDYENMLFYLNKAYKINPNDTIAGYIRTMSTYVKKQSS